MAIKPKSKPLGRQTEKLKDRRPRARVIGQKLNKIKRLNPTRRLQDLRPGLTTSKATGG